MPALEQIAANDSRTPGPASLGPNMVPTHAAKYTTSIVSPATAGADRGVTAGVATTDCTAESCTAPFRLARDCPPPGNSADHSGKVSESITLRPNRFGPVTRPAGSLPAVLR